MKTSYWETEQKMFEARVYSGSGIKELRDVIDTMTGACILYNGNADSLEFRTDGEAVVISFRGESSSVGWTPGE
jgi:hypothetical protein